MDGMAKKEYIIIAAVVVILIAVFVVNKLSVTKLSVGIGKASGGTENCLMEVHHGACKDLSCRAYPQVRAGVSVAAGCRNGVRRTASEVRCAESASRVRRVRFGRDSLVRGSSSRSSKQNSRFPTNPYGPFLLSISTRRQNPQTPSPPATATHTSDIRARCE